MDITLWKKEGGLQQQRERKKTLAKFERVAYLQKSFPTLLCMKRNTERSNAKCKFAMS